MRPKAHLLHSEKPQQTPFSALYFYLCLILLTGNQPDIIAGIVFF